ncbi:MAG: T9SS type A sorting domain-containing protein [Melioribacteraceae bacterium]
MKKQSYLVFIFLLITLATLSGQTAEQIKKYREDNYGNKSERKRGILDGNFVRTIFINDGQVGYWEDRPSGEWPKGSNHSSMDGSCIMLGAEFTAPGNAQVIHSVEGSYREYVDVNPVTGDEWVLEPIPGYSNPSSLTPAINMKPSTWPISWPKALLGADDSLNGKWYGLKNNSLSIGSLESFFVMDDSKDFEFTKEPYLFLPVKNDPNRGGLGLRIETREMQFIQSPVEDVIFSVHDIYNISDFDYPKFVLGIYLDSGMGGLDDHTDDSAGYIKEENLVYIFDQDGISQYQNWNTGFLGIAFLKTPLNDSGKETGLNNVVIDKFSNKGPNSIFLSSDESLWNKLSQKIFTGTQLKENIQLIMGTGLFEFKKGTKKQFISAFVWGMNLDELLLNKYASELLCDNDFSISAFNKLSIGISNLSALKEIKGEVELNYNATNYISQNLKTALLVSSDGVTFEYYKTDNEFTGKFKINSKDFPDGILYKFKVVCFSKTDYGEFVTPNSIVINNEEKVPPQIRFISPNDSLYTFKEMVKVQWESGDADSDQFQTEIYFGNNSTKWELLYKTTETGMLEYNWNTISIGNSDSYVLKAVLRSQTDSTIVLSRLFKINNAHKLLDARGYSESIKTLGTGDLFLSVINPALLSKDRYLLKFVKLADSTTKGYTVKNITKNEALIKPTALQKNTESELFDGIRLIINDEDKKEIIPGSTKWISGNCNYDVTVMLDKSSPSRNIFQPYDYKISFYNQPVYTSPFTKVALSLKVLNTVTNQPVDCELFDNDRNYQFNIGDDIVLVEYPNNDLQFRLSWRIQFRYPVSGDVISPKEGDVLAFSSYKPFQVGDEIIFSTANIDVGVDDDKNVLPVRFKLNQNFPNPFNPQTIIKYEVSTLSKVEIKIFDVLGREIKTLVNETKLPGKYEAAFNASGLPSGVYFYRIQTPSFSETKKMIYLK